MEITRRYRVNVGTSVKGIKTFDCTIEITDSEAETEVLRDAILKESDALVQALDKRYPPQEN